MSQAIRLAMRLAEPLKNRANGSHGHWSSVSRPRRQLREMVFTLAMLSEIRRAYERWTTHAGRSIPVLRPGTWLAGDLVVLVTRISPTFLDGHDGLTHACKPVVDAMADALGLRADRDPRVSWRYAHRKGEPALEILIEPRRACAACGQAAEREWRICPTCGLAFAQVVQEQEQTTSKRAGRVSERNSS